MISKSELKIWLRSGSWRFARESRRGQQGGEGSVAWNGHPVYYRVGTSDSHVIHSILLKRGKKAEYHVPASFEPATILDIGGNIGAAALYFAKTYPKAKVFSFEPVAANYALLAKNIAPYPAIRGYNLALGATDGTIDLIESPDAGNFGGFSVFQRGATADCRRIPVQCRNAGAMLGELGIEVPDLIKVDTEGAEYAILTAFPQEVLARVPWILGELHGENDFELLAYLSQWFDIGIKKSVRSPLCNFHARNRQLGR